MEATVSEIHRHPMRPTGFEEPLFLGRDDKRKILEHLRESSCWLGKASDVSATGRSEESCHVFRRPDGSAHLVRAGSSCPGRRRGTRKSRVRRVIGRWREVSGWWEPEGGTDRLCFRVLIAGRDRADGAVVDLALDRNGSGGWTLTRVWD